MASSDTKTMSVLAHVLGLFVGFIGPLIIYLVSEDNTAKSHAKYALNWQISATIYIIVSFVLVFVIVGIPLLFAVGVINLIFSIMAAVKASHGELWKYPLSIQFLKVK